MVAGIEAAQVDAPFASDDLVRRLGGASVDGVGKIMESAIRILDRDHAGALQGFAFHEVFEGEVRSAAIEINCFREGLEKSRFAGAPVEDAGFDCVQAFGEVGEVGGEAVMAIGNLDGAFEAARGHRFTVLVHRAVSVQVPTLPPFHHNVVDDLSILLRTRIGIADIDLHSVARQASYIADRLGGSVPSGGNGPGNGTHATATELEGINP